jgi:hypothetical protein
MDEPLVKNYKFTEAVGKDGMPKYFINGSEIQDKASFERLKAKTSQVMDDVMKDSTADFDAAYPMPEFMKRPIKKAKGGKINLADCKVNTAKKNSSNSRW